MAACSNQVVQTGDSVCAANDAAERLSHPEPERSIELSVVMQKSRVLPRASGGRSPAAVQFTSILALTLEIYMLPLTIGFSV